MVLNEKLYLLTSDRFRLPYGIDRNFSALTVAAENIPIVTWPSGGQCLEANLFMLACFERGLGRKGKGGTLAQYAKLLSHLIRFCYQNSFDFIDLTDAKFSLFIAGLHAEYASSNGKKKRRSPSHILTIGRISLTFLHYVGELFLDENLVSTNGRIRAEKRTAKILTSGKSIERTYWHHHSFPRAEPSKKRLPISRDSIEKIYDAIPGISSSTYIRRRRFIFVKLLEITGARRVEISNIKVEDVLKAHTENGQCFLKVLTAKRRDPNLFRYIPITKLDLELLINFIEKFRIRIVRNTVGVSKDSGYLFLSQTTGKKLATETLTNEMLLLAKAAGISEQACAHMFRHRYITRLFVAMIQHHDFSNKDNFKHILMNAESFKKKVQEYTGHASAASLDIYIHMAFEELANFSETLNVIKARSTIESLRTNLLNLTRELPVGISPSELVELVAEQLSVALKDI